MVLNVSFILCSFGLTRACLSFYFVTSTAEINKIDENREFRGSKLPFLIVELGVYMFLSRFTV
jgi:hypothetical protein